MCVYIYVMPNVADVFDCAGTPRHDSSSVSVQLIFHRHQFTHPAVVAKFLWEMNQSCQDAAVNGRLPRESLSGVESHHNSFCVYICSA